MYFHICIYTCKVTNQKKWWFCMRCIAVFTSLSAAKAIPDLMRKRQKAQTSRAAFRVDSCDFSWHTLLDKSQSQFWAPTDIWQLRAAGRILFTSTSSAGYATIQAGLQSLRWVAYMSACTRRDGPAQPADDQHFLVQVDMYASHRNDCRLEFAALLVLRR